MKRAQAKWAKKNAARVQGYNRKHRGEVGSEKRAHFNELRRNRRKLRELEAMRRGCNA